MSPTFARLVGKAGAPLRSIGRRRWVMIASRVVAAIGGGYAVAAAAAICLALALPGPRAEAVLTGMLLSFAVYAGAVIWVFAAATATRAWIGLAIPGAALAAIAWLAGGGGAA
ncbi:hypothetical protein STVA_05200 [Allostella vacuolata]|nr:hypothetical protein STVA_05200 [Stella vacuolata]